MAINARMNANDDRLYNPARDVAHNFKAVVTELADRYASGRWPVLHNWLEDELLDGADDAACEAVESLVAFVRSSVEDPAESMQDVLTRAGWFDVPEEAQAVALAYLGSIICGLFFTGARETTIGNKGPVSDVKDLIAAGRECRRLMALPRWRKRLIQLRYRISTTIAGLLRLPRA